jgi:hypothetical protein
MLQPTNPNHYRKASMNEREIATLVRELRDRKPELNYAQARRQVERTSYPDRRLRRRYRDGAR